MGNILSANFPRPIIKSPAAPPPAPKPPGLPTLPLTPVMKMLPKATNNVATHIALPIVGTPTINLPIAHGIIANLPTSSNAQNFASSTASAAAAGNPEAQGNATLLTLAQRVQTQAKYVAKWFGQAAANQILSAQHLAVPTGAVGTMVSQLVKKT